MGHDPVFGEESYNRGSGEKDLGPAQRPNEIKDTGVAGGAPPAGALAAFGGIKASTVIRRAKVGTAPSIALPGYPMQGEAGSAGMNPGAMDAGDDPHPKTEGY